ncbi:hypothetical protein LshimejAT787_0901600 [Lyophyllum shimeji]|uniref:Uncharacterized protein n=1 Tax=Lyophyllum shimeji TaxID=47721 RepID=A0A9P3UR56_LYOSH|nr:hypothetical protein LshimejAT787_0901600 [Lyophyllum shimeji]
MRETVGGYVLSLKCYALIWRFPASFQPRPIPDYNAGTAGNLLPTLVTILSASPHSLPSYTHLEQWPLVASDSVAKFAKPRGFFDRLKNEDVTWI